MRRLLRIPVIVGVLLLAQIPFAPPSHAIGGGLYVGTAVFDPGILQAVSAPETFSADGTWYHDDGGVPAITPCHISGSSPVPQTPFATEGSATANCPGHVLCPAPYARIGTELVFLGGFDGHLKLVPTDAQGRTVAFVGTLNLIFC